MFAQNKPAQQSTSTGAPTKTPPRTKTDKRDAEPANDTGERGAPRPPEPHWDPVISSATD